MTIYEDAVSIILNNVHTLPEEEKALSASLGQVTAEDVYSPVTLPQRSAAGPDGYAVRSADVAGASRETPITLRIQETVRAGRLPKHKVEAGVAFRIMTRVCQMAHNRRQMGASDAYGALRRVDCS